LILFSDEICERIIYDNARRIPAKLRLCSNVPAQLAIYQIRDDQSFILDLLEDTHVLAVQGSGFNWPDIDTLKTAADRIEEFLKDFRKSEI
jgi:aspartate/methionine/tyrosine aminotransferase